MSQVAFLFPGQGSQQVGMAKELCEQFPIARQLFEQANEVLQFDLLKLCVEGPADDLAQTANTQPAILSCSIAAWKVLDSELGLRPFVALGHSLGEFSALVAVGALDFSDALKLVRLRGQAMQEAVPTGVGAMAAILGVEADQVEAICKSISKEGHLVAPANENGGGQIVIAGHAPAVQEVASEVKEIKGRAIPLRVSAPFHCALMKPAADRLKQALEVVPITPFTVPVIANVDAEPNSDPNRVKGLLVDQVTSKVRWEASVRKAVHMGAESAIEIGHGRVLAGLVKRIAPQLTVRSASSPSDINVLKVGAP